MQCSAFYYTLSRFSSFFFLLVFPLDQDQLDKPRSCFAWLSPAGSYRHYEFDPLVVARAHQFAGRRRILNKRLLAQYTALLHILARLPADKVGDEECLSLAYYLVLQVGRHGCKENDSRWR